MNRIVLVGILLLSNLLSSVSHASEEAFWQLLEGGHKVLLVRHATLSEEFGSPFVLDDSCFSERNLSDFGREQARWINQQLKAHSILVEAVMASPHCRTQETAQLLAEGLQQVTVNPSLRLTKAVSPEVAERNMAATRDLIRNYQGKGILILVTHRPNIGELIYQSIEPAEMAVVEAFAGDTFDILARLQVPLINQNQ
ncbi:histidine phosphatase family protein [Thiosulfativibrio zosterae]|uniref:Histidine phosphatase family protein n=1 Tax=Thiosulfativibrio zosterae TaxID=2675053 RepID=A0A6F8PMW1_9GAMM|nr:histidine phosphatase family protein [Thiosulfativibrio zosterae]BBP43442.1 hypothetical protein THMIRHAT_11880 [Thiosulfativibrio zosterae]